MGTFTVVTGNQHKLASYQRLLPKHITWEHADLDLEEIQSLDSKQIIIDKAKRAYEIIKNPVLVEDVTAGLDILNGLPGPFIKYFEQQLGKDALYQLAGKESPAVVSCTICLYDGRDFVFATGTVRGTVVPARGENGFGFDYCFLADGQTKTYAEMTHAEKDAISHRTLAVNELLSQLGQL